MAAHYISDSLFVNCFYCGVVVELHRLFASNHLLDAETSGAVIGGNGDPFLCCNQLPIMPRLDRYNINLLSHFEISPAVVSLERDGGDGDPADPGGDATRPAEVQRVDQHRRVRPLRLPDLALLSPRDAQRPRPARRRSTLSAETLRASLHIWCLEPGRRSRRPFPGHRASPRPRTDDQ